MLFLPSSKQKVKISIAEFLLLYEIILKYVLRLTTDLENFIINLSDENSNRSEGLGLYACLQNQKVNYNQNKNKKTS